MSHTCGDRNKEMPDKVLIVVRIMASKRTALLSFQLLNTCFPWCDVYDHMQIVGVSLHDYQTHVFENSRTAVLSLNFSTFSFHDVIYTIICKLSVLTFTTTSHMCLRILGLLCLLFIFSTFLSICICVSVIFCRPALGWLSAIFWLSFQCVYEFPWTCHEIRTYHVKMYVCISSVLAYHESFSQHVVCIKMALWKVKVYLVNRTFSRCRFSVFKMIWTWNACVSENAASWDADVCLK